MYCLLILSDFLVKIINNTVQRLLDRSRLSQEGKNAQQENPFGNKGNGARIVSVGKNVPNAANEVSKQQGQRHQSYTIQQEKHRLR